MAKSALDQTAWERGIASAASAFDRKRSPLGALQAVRLVPPLWSFVVMCDAPRRQRNEARLYASSLEHQVTAYKEWVRRRQIGEDFKEEALGLVNTLPYQLQHVYDIETATADWRTRLQIVGRQLEAHGGSVECAEQIENSLRALDETEGDGYPDQESRLRNSMLSAGQNIWTYLRNEEQPASPPRPSGSADA